MAIQFPCPSCTQPIEVDDEVAGREAACPYCHRVVTAPLDSTYSPRPFVEARPADVQPSPSTTYAPPPIVVERSPAPPLPSSAGLHVGAPPPPSLKVAVAYGNYALVCAALVAASFLGAMALSIAALEPLLRKQIAGAAPASMQDVQKALVDYRHSGWIAALHVGAAFFALIGTLFSLASLRARTAGNVRGWLSLFVCAPMLTCFCGGQVFALFRVAG